MNFGEAIKALKQGKKVSRESWPGKYLIAVNGYYSWDKATLKTFPECVFYYESLKKKVVEFQPSIFMKTKENNIITGWTASQECMLANDWIIVE